MTMGPDDLLPASPDPADPAGTAPVPTGRSGKRAAILGAAAREFLSHGYGATSMDEVARRAGVSKRTVYFHFGSKERLFAATIEHKCRDMADPLQDGRWRTMPLEDALTDLGRRFMALLLSPESRALERILTMEAVRFPQLSEVFYRAGPEALQRGVARFLDDRVARGELRLDDTTLAAGCLLMMVQGKVVKCAMMCPSDPPGADEVEATIRFAVRLFLDGARG
ncbi:MAG: TetR/AcrR family transcriptional regulator [Hyphomicrobiales bacterium]|nr:TetR/AcrR family transcriptional regulator [Hyphomicrobiales bacterium]MCP5372220.1 TetR/AcrR family transcriptional regulator [Hyphomicrobiales bacterium]